MPSFEIPDSPAQLELRNQAVNGKPFRVATTTFTVTNKTASALSGRFKINPQGDAKAEWLALEGEKERPFGPSETQKVNVTVSLPAEVPAGEYKFRLVVMNVNDPGNDFTESAVVTFSPPKAPPTTKKPIWPYIVAAVVLLLIVGGVVFYLVFFRNVTVTNVVGMTKDQAMAALSDQGLTATVVDDHTPGGIPGHVVKEDPDHDTSVAKGSEVKIFVAVAPPPPPSTAIDIPNVVTTPTMSFDAARQKLLDAGFTNVSSTPVNGTASGAPVGNVIGQTPPLPAKVEPNTPISLTVDPGVPIPGGLVNTSWNDIGNQLKPFSVTLNHLGDDGPDNIIASLVPASGSLPLHGELQVNVHSKACHMIPIWRCFIVVGPIHNQNFYKEKYIGKVITPTP